MKIYMRAPAMMAGRRWVTARGYRNSHLRVDAYGSIDEANSVIGIAKLHIKPMRISPRSAGTIFKTIFST